ncbi:MAG: TIGR03767 family metallophosphoesterase [Candidatus Nanopelagicales bacterium]|nr:TIGR03767 family metallophosphoesterase [Candidatus Nanopelagicales bacterium]
MRGAYLPGKPGQLIAASPVEWAFPLGTWNARLVDRPCVASAGTAILGLEGNVGGLSRRRFLAVSGGLAATWALPVDWVGRALAAPVQPAEVRTTLVGTIRKAGTSGYVKLVATAGEPLVTRLDVLGAEPKPDRTKNRRSLLYLGHISDLHLIDAQTPARLDTMAAVDPVLFSGNFRPQEVAQVQILSQLVAALNSAASSPITGAPMGFVLNTGDNTDQRSHQEMRWFVDTLDGGKITANTGKAGEYEGVQAWPECTFAYHPDDPSNDVYGQQHGYPAYPGLLKAAVSNPVDSAGLKMPWYAVYGNHDANYFGGWPTGWMTDNLATGGRKAATHQATERFFGTGMGATSTFEQQFIGKLTTLGIGSGVRDVTADPNRKLIDLIDYMRELIDSPANPGPVGHGFTQGDIDNQKTYWATDVTPYIRVLGLNSCNVTVGAGGSIPEDQYQWLQQELMQARKARKLVIIASHHTSFTMDNVAQPVIGPQQSLIEADELISMLHEYPNMIAWMNGHTHLNRITAHRNPEGGGGFWEISSSSCVDFEQQGRVTEIVDNRDGTLSIFTVVLDHEAPAQTNVRDLSVQGISAISRELAANDPAWDPNMLLGSAQDRNCELLVPAPFDMSAITDALVEETQIKQKTRLLARKEPA